MARQRAGLAGPLSAALARHEGADKAALEAWAGAVLELANVNAGPGALLAAFRAAALAAPAPGALPALAPGVSAAAELCRHAGAAAARAALETRADLGARFARDPRGEAAWWGALIAMAREAPEQAVAAIGASGVVLDRCGADGFAAFLAAALACSPQRERRAAFLSLADPQARRLLDRLSGRAAFSSQQKRLAAFATALWGRTIPLRPLEGEAARARVAEGVVFVPESFADPAPALFRACVAHATAHLVFASPRRQVGALKPAQVILTGLIEDARVEALAMRRFPGLRRLWAPFHVAAPAVARDAPTLFARLAHALFDPDYADADGFVAKGRALFAAEPDLEDPELSRRIGGLIGNDLGQMRIPFNPKAYVVEPAYRDDPLGFWDLPADAGASEMEAPVEAARPKPQEGGGGGGERDAVGRARAAQAETAKVLARYPEWDRAQGVERPDWTTVRELAPTPAPPYRLEEALQRDAALTARIDRLVRGARLGRPVRLKRQPFGLDLDLEAAVEAAKSLRIGETPDERIYLRKQPQRSHLAILVLVDVSESTRDAAGAVSVLDVEKQAVAALARAMSGLGDSFALIAFSSCGRQDVRLTRIADFGEPFDRAALARLAGLAPGFSTRLGAALRHAGAELRPRVAERKLLIVLSDGAPSDIDVADPADLVEDARRAALGLKAQGIDVFGLTLDPSGAGAGAAVFGRSRCLPVRRIEDLPARLSDLYFRVSRR